MHILMFLTQFVRDMKSQKLGTFLTLFGIIWGTTAVILLLAFGESFEKQTKKDMLGLGERIVYLYYGTTTKAYKGLGKGRIIYLKEEDASLLKREIKEIKAITPEYRKSNIMLKYKKNTYLSQITGIYPIYHKMRNITPQSEGRFVNYLDIKSRKRVVFIGDELKKILFKDESPVGEYIYLNNVPFLVIGIMNKTPEGWFNKIAFIPASTFSNMFGYRYVSDIIYQTKDPRLSEYVKKKVYQVLGRKYKFDPEDREAIYMWDTTEFEKIMIYFFLGFRIFLGIVGTFTLIVGGIGVANIMNVVVEDRTKEIGIKMAVGAKKRFIMFQFIFETLVIVFIGGIIGFGISYAITQIFPFFKLEEYVGYPTISLFVAVIATLILGTVGLIAGYLPARRAANLNPVEALRE